MSGILMMLALVWLTISTPFIYSAQQKKQHAERLLKINEGEEESSLPGSTEEKSQSNVNKLSEYLQEFLMGSHFYRDIQTFMKCHPADLYFAFHPDLFSPPPEA